jgi:hypothetical protein
VRIDSVNEWAGVRKSRLASTYHRCPQRGDLLVSLSDNLQAMQSKQWVR